MPQSQKFLSETIALTWRIMRISYVDYVRRVSYPRFPLFMMFLANLSHMEWFSKVRVRSSLVECIVLNTNTEHTRCFRYVK